MTNYPQDGQLLYEQEPNGDEGFMETIVFIAAIVLTYATGFANGTKEMTSFLVLAVLGLLAWGWLFKAAIPDDSDDTGL